MEDNIIIRVTTNGEDLTIESQGDSRAIAAALEALLVDLCESIPENDGGGVALAMLINKLVVQQLEDDLEVE